MDLWALTGYQPQYRPSSGIFRLALWDAARVAYEEGWGWQPGPRDGLWEDSTVQAAAECGVDVFG